MTILIARTTLVVVDKDLEIQKMLSSYFGKLGYVVINYSDGNKAVNDSVTQGNFWDIILTDFNFQDISGYDFTSKIKAVYPKIQIILISNSESKQLPLENDTSLAVKKNLTINQCNTLKNIIENIKKTQLINKNKFDLDIIVGKSQSFVDALSTAKKVANCNANIFIYGESGTGKELFARYIHTNSEKKNGPFVAINCSAIPENLLESELFGHAKGSFTGAIDKKLGLFESAENGTLFLDEIGDLSLPLQAKLLRVLQEKKIKRVGENQSRDVNCRIISATHKNLLDEVNKGFFREDLYFRLNVIPIRIPPLRERKDDLLLLTESFINKYCMINKIKLKTISTEARQYILEHQWRGNVRELENTIERAVILSESDEIKIDDLSYNDKLFNIITPTIDFTNNSNTFFYQHNSHLPLLEEIIQKYIEYAVLINGGARDKTAKEIGIDRKTLYKRIK